MKRILTIASALIIAMPLALFAGNGRGGGQAGGPRGIHTPGTGQVSGSPQGTPGGQRLRDGSGTGQKQQKRQKKGKGQQNGQCQTQGSTTNS